MGKSRTGRSRRIKILQETTTFSEKVKCSGGLHTVFVNHKNQFVFTGHPGISVQVLAAEARLRTECDDHCLVLARDLIDGSSPWPWLPLWMKRVFENIGKKRNIRKAQQLWPYLDAMPLSKRRLYSTWLWPKALETLIKAKFKTTEKWGHSISLLTTKGTTKVLGRPASWKDADIETVPKDRDKRIRDRKSPKPFAGKVQRIELNLNLVQFARVLKYKAQLVEGQVVLRVLIVKSPKQLVVQMLKQSTGYHLKVIEAEIRLGSDDVWRVINLRL